MKHRSRDAIYTGVRLGLGMVAGICTMSLLAYGFAKLRFPEVDNSLLTFLKAYPPRLVGVICVVIALAVLVSTLDRWAKLLAGLFAYAAVGGLLAVFAGGFHSRIASLELNRLGAAVMTALFGACALLTMRLSRDGLGWVDRAAAECSPTPYVGRIFRKGYHRIQDACGASGHFRGDSSLRSHAESVKKEGRIGERPTCLVL
jgi:uncharacterized membrane protein YdcZ (DUF606 family)